MDGGFLGPLRKAGLVALAAGAAGSLFLTLYAGRGSAAALAVALVALWVLTPYALLALAYFASRSWSDLTRAALYSAMILVTIGSLPIYAIRVFHPPAREGAAIFVAVPPASWLLIAVVLTVAALTARSTSRGGRT